MTGTMTDGWALMGLAVLATGVWRLAGALLVDRLDEGGAFFAWMTAIAYAMVAGLMARMVLTPAGVVEPTEILLRFAAAAVGFGIWFWRGRAVMAGLLAGVLAYGLLSWLARAFDLLPPW